MPTLGCSRHVAFVQDKCNGPRLCELTEASSISYERKLDDVSAATVVIPLYGDATAPCCVCLGDVEPWCHQLTIVREGDGVVWTGPITKVRYGRDEVTIEAKDKLAWLQFRVNELAVSYPDNFTVSMTTIAQDIIFKAMAEDSDAPCFLSNSFTSFQPGTYPGILDLGDGRPSGTSTEAQAGGSERSFIFEPFAGPTAFDDLAQLGDAGMDFTVMNQVLILMSEDLPDRAIGVLTDEMILGDIEVIKDGEAMGSRFYVRWEGDEDCDTCAAPQGAGCPCPAFAEVAEGDEQCYGAIERIIDGLSANSQGTAQNIANLYLARGRTAPRLIELPEGTRLSPDVPWEMNDMIPGQRIDVALTSLCLPVFQSFKLQNVSVTDEGDDEIISVDLVAVEQTSS